MDSRYLSPDESRISEQSVKQYETAKAGNCQIYLDVDQFIDVIAYYQKEGKDEEAREAIQHGLLIHPENTDLLIRLAYYYLGKRQADKALETAERIKEEHCPTVVLLKAELLLEKRQLRKAKELLDGIEDKDDLELIADIAYLYISMGYPEEAKLWLERGEKTGANDEAFLEVSACYLDSAHQAKEAMTVYHQLTEINPYDERYWVGLAKCNLITGDMEAAIENCDLALTVNEKYGMAYNYRAHCYFYLNNMEQASQDYKMAIRYNGLPPETGYMFLGLICVRNSQWEEAYRYYREVVQSISGNDDGCGALEKEFYMSMAIATFELGKHEEAYQMCDKALKNNSDKEEVLLTKGELYLREGRTEEALREFKKAMKTEAEDVEVWHAMAQEYEEQGKTDQAECCYLEAFRIDSEYLDVSESLALIYLIKEDIENFIRYNAQSKYPIPDYVVSMFQHSSKQDFRESKQLIKSAVDQLKQIQREKTN